MNSLRKLAKKKRPILVCYLPLGDPAIEFDQARVYADCGVDVFEIGVPSELPFMDGPVITKSMQRVIAAGVSQADIAHKLIELKRAYPEVGIVVMGYENMELSTLSLDGSIGFDGVLKIETSDADIVWLSEHSEVDQICFVPHEMPMEAMQCAAVASGYIMLQATAGATGIRSDLDENNREKIRILKEANVTIPIALGFGISNAEQVSAAITMGAGGVIIGSACVLHAQLGESELREFLMSIRETIDEVWD